MMEDWNAWYYDFDCVVNFGRYLITKKIITTIEDLQPIEHHKQ